MNLNKFILCFLAAGLGTFGVMLAIIFMTLDPPYLNA
jgi:hypothetical protein